MSDASNKHAQPSLSIDAALTGIEPASVWRCFGDLARIPRASGNEAGVREYVQAFAAQRSIVCEVNEVGDVLLRVNPGAHGAIVAVQAHMDMVCVAEGGRAFDFAREPIRLKRDGDFIRADGTTLGADNGIGVAYALALADEVTGPFEVLLTVDEETGFTGIEGVAPGWLRAGVLINLDSEEEGYLTIASAGARDFRVRVPGDRGALTAAVEALAVTVDGLKGGHSGIEIHRNRTNALKVMGQVLAAAGACGGVVYGMKGGTAPNVIPSNSAAVVGLPVERAAEFRKLVAGLQQAVATDEDPSLRIDISTTTESRKPLTPQSAGKLILLLDELPHGILVPSPRDPAQPFVSNNVGMVRELADGGFEVTLMSRSPASEELVSLAGRYGAIAEKNGATVSAGNLVPGWAPDYASPLLARFQRHYKAQYGSEAKVLEIHAGLECGALQGKYPGMDLISIGPDITGAHSPKEKVSIASTRRTYELVRTVIRELQQAEG